MSKKQCYNNNIEFHFLDAPYQHSDGGLTWTDPPLDVTDIWHDENSVDTRQDALHAVPKIPYNLSILERSFQLLDEEIQKIQPHVLLGFSQGSFVIYEYIRNKWTPSSTIRKIIAMSGYTFDNILSDEVYDIDILNVVHPMDNVVPASLMFDKSNKVKILKHNNKNYVEPCREAHVMPTRNNDMRYICDFILDK
jgi:predicted esterase